MRVFRTLYRAAGIGLFLLAFWAPVLALELALLFAGAAGIGALVRAAMKALDRFERAGGRERIRKAVTSFLDQHPLASAAFVFGAFATTLGVGSAISPLWDPAATGGVSWPFLKLAGVLFALGLVGLIVRYFIEFEWRHRVAVLEQRVVELEGRADRQGADDTSGSLHAVEGIE